MQCKELALVLEQDGLGTLPAEAQAHLADCPACQGMLADLAVILETASTLPREVAPPERVWISLCAQLEAEGIIRDPAIAEPFSWRQRLSTMFRPRFLAPAAAAVALAFFTYFQFHRETVPAPAANSAIRVQQAARPVAPVAAAPAASASAPVQQAKSSTSEARSATDQPLKPSPTELAGATLSTLTSLEDDVPNMRLADNAAVDVSMRQNLRTLNEFIKECQARLKQNPQDELAREYLYNAYEQKAELLSAMMESGRSEH